MMYRKFLIVLLVFCLVVIYLCRSFFDVSFSSAQAKTVKNHFSGTHQDIFTSKVKLQKLLRDQKDISSTQNVIPKILVDLSSEEFYCKLKKLNLGIPIEGNVKIVTHTDMQSDESNDIDDRKSETVVAWISSDKCPLGSYSKVRLNSDGVPLELIDCRQVSREELVIHSGMQGAIKDSLPEFNRVNFAISGPGFFIEDCGERLNYIRSGEFLIAMDGTVMTKSGCEILAEDGVSLSLHQEDELDEQGCNNENRCIAVVNPGAKDIVYNGGEKFLAITSPEGLLLRDKHLFKNAYEDLSTSELGPFGPDFSRVPLLKKTANCLDP